ncbi:MAG: hypothetical protein DRJ50_15615, partial [Actinobacteria bacterium]
MHQIGIGEADASVKWGQKLIDGSRRSRDTRLDDRTAGRLVNPLDHRHPSDHHRRDIELDINVEIKGAKLAGPTHGVSFRPGELEIREDGTGNLLGSRCRACGAYFFPIREACSGCLSDNLETVVFSPEGTLYTYSIVRQSTPQFEVPYALGYVDFPEGVRIMGQIGGCELNDIKIGMPMTLSLEPFGKDENDNPLTGYRFVPMEA